MSAVLNLKTKPNYNRAPSEVFYPESDGQPMAETDKHRKLLIEISETLDRHFARVPDVYVTGNIMFYYVEDAPEECTSPDVMVCFGVPKGYRRTYRTWEENDVIPSVIFEITSRKTGKTDRVEKKELYALLGVREYFIYNPEHPKALPALLAFRLGENGQYETLTLENKRVFSQVLNLEVVETNDALRLFDLTTKAFLPISTELDQIAQKAEAKAEAAEAKAEAAEAKISVEAQARVQAEAKADAESKARTAAEAEIKRLKAELARLKNEPSN